MGACAFSRVTSLSTSSTSKSGHLFAILEDSHFTFSVSCFAFRFSFRSARPWLAKSIYSSGASSGSYLVAASTMKANYLLLLSACVENSSPVLYRYF